MMVYLYVLNVNTLIPTCRSVLRALRALARVRVRSTRQPDLGFEEGTVALLTDAFNFFGLS